jgi:hypothetical protein
MSIYTKLTTGRQVQNKVGEQATFVSTLLRDSSLSHAKHVLANSSLLAAIL